MQKSQFQLKKIKWKSIVMSFIFMQTIMLITFNVTNLSDFNTETIIEDIKLISKYYVIILAMIISSSLFK